MSDIPDWLPDLLLFSDYDGEWEMYLEALYQHFCRDFVNSKPSYPGKRWALKRYPLEKGKEATFWHLISEGQAESERLPDLRRCERICWPRAMIDAISAGRVKVWRNQRGGEQRVLLALEDFSYVVVLADRGDYILLWTAYGVEREHTRDKLRKEYESAVKNGLAAPP